VGYGDEILAAGQAQRHYEATGQRVQIVDLHGRPRWHPIWEGNPVIVKPDTGSSNGRPPYKLLNAPNARPYIVYPFTPESGWTFNTSFRAREHVAKIYLTGDEQRRGWHVKYRYGAYVLIEPWSKHENLRWPLDHWQALIAARSDLTWVQHTHKDSPMLQGVHREPATFREACGLIASAEVYIRGESGLLHAAAALGTQTIALWGGCMDWDVLGNYPKQLGLGISRPSSPRSAS
jgi:hypothetical protein